MKLVVDNRVRMQLDSLPSIVKVQLCELFRYANPEYLMLKRLNKIYALKNCPTVIRTYEIDEENNSITFPRGGFFRIRELLNEYRIAYTVEDNRVFNQCEGIPDSIVDLEKYQIDVVEAAIKNQNCLIRAPTGSGKTTAAINLIGRLKTPTVVVVWMNKLMEQWVDRIRVELGLDENQVGVWGGQKRRKGLITVAMDQTLSNETPQWMKEETGLLICDEVQRFAAKSFQNVVNQFSSKYRIGLSADETRKDGLEPLIYDQFGRVRYEISQGDVDATGRTVPVKIVLVPTDFYTSSKIPHERAELIMNDNIRTNLIYELTNELEGKQCLVYARRVDHCVSIDLGLIERGFQSGLCVGDKKYKAEFVRTKDQLLEGTTQFGVGTIGAIGTGIDLPSIEAAIIADPIANNIQLFNQVRGRICRASKDKTHGIIFYLWDQHVYGFNVVRNLIKKYGSENVFIRVNRDTYVEPRLYKIPARKEPTLFDLL